MNISIASIQDRLHNVAKSTGKDFQLILTRYFQERLLFRLSQTPINATIKIPVSPKNA